MFDELDEVEEVTVDPCNPGAFAADLLAAAEARDTVKQKLLLGSFDDGLEVAVHAASDGSAGTQAAFADWLQLLIHAVSALATHGLEHFVWEAPGKERVGAALVRRLQATVNSGTFDSVKVEQPTSGQNPTGLVLILGRGGTGFDDLQAVEEYWRGEGCAIVQANHCGLKRLKEREMDRILQVLVDQGVARLGLLCHLFSENGSYFWCHLLARWEQCPPSGLPPCSEVLRGCVYDSCFSFAGFYNNSAWVGARGDMAQIAEQRVMAKKGSARHVTMNAALAMARRVFGPHDDRTLALADLSGPVFKGIVDVYAHRGSSDDPIFDSGGPDMATGHAREPLKISRLVFVSMADVTLSFTDVLDTVEWMKQNRGVVVEQVTYETSMNCSMHRDDPAAYFGRIGDWTRRMPRFSGS